MITTSQVRETIEWVDRSDVCPQLEAMLRRTRRGRPRQLTVRALLVGLKLAVDEAKTSCLTDVHQILTHQLRRHDQLELQVANTGQRGCAITVHQVRRLFSSISRVLDPSPHANPGLDDQDRGDDDRGDRGAALQAVLDRLLDATMTADVTHHGSYAVDGTGIWSWSRGKRRSQVSADRDARWGTKTAKTGGQEPYFGYELHAVVRINSTRQDRRLVPCLAERIVVTPAATNPVTAVLPTLGRLATHDRIREVVADRGYTYKTNWTRDLYALGIEPVLDLHKTQYGARGSHDGARIITGVPHCPATPTGLDTIGRPERLADSPALDAFVDQITRREQWAFRRVTTADTTGKERYECPARAGKVRCALHPPSLAKPLALPTVINPPIDATPKCCSQRTITVPGEVDAKNRQRHYWGSRDWITAFSRRSRVEGWFGNLKNSNTEGLTRGAFRVMGIAKTSLMLGIYAAATNLRLLRIWTHRQPTDPMTSAEGLSSARRLERGRPGSTPTRANGPPTG